MRFVGRVLERLLGKQDPPNARAWNGTDLITGQKVEDMQKSMTASICAAAYAAVSLANATFSACQLLSAVISAISAISGPE